MTQWYRFDIQDRRLQECSERDVDEENERRWIADLKADRNIGWRCVLDLDHLMLAQARYYKSWYIVYIHPVLLSAGFNPKKGVF